MLFSRLEDSKRGNSTSNQPVLYKIYGHSLLTVEDVYIKENCIVFNPVVCHVYIEGDSVEIKTEADSNDMITVCVYTMTNQFH